MADYVQLEIFDLKLYDSGTITPDIYIVPQVKQSQGIEDEQLELDLFPIVPDESYFDLTKAA